jgi:hypothetical protein
MLIVLKRGGDCARSEQILCDLFSVTDYNHSDLTFGKGMHLVITNNIYESKSSWRRA